MGLHSMERFPPLPEPRRVVDTLGMDLTQDETEFQDAQKS